MQAMSETAPNHGALGGAYVLTEEGTALLVERTEPKGSPADAAPEQAQPADQPAEGDQA